MGQRAFEVEGTLVDGVGQPLDGGGLQKRRDRKSDPEFLLDPVEHPHGQQGMPPQLDEILLHADRTDIHGVHIVQPGDTLSKIAKVHLDDAKRYMEIFNANKDILKDPNLIKVGQKLVIPKR